MEDIHDKEMWTNKIWEVELLLSKKLNYDQNKFDNSIENCSIYKLFKEYNSEILNKSAEYWVDLILREDSRIEKVLKIRNILNKHYDLYQEELNSIIEYILNLSNDIIIENSEDYLIEDSINRLYDEETKTYRIESKSENKYSSCKILKNYVSAKNPFAAVKLSENNNLDNNSYISVRLVEDFENEINYIEESVLLENEKKELIKRLCYLKETYCLIK